MPRIAWVAFLVENWHIWSQSWLEPLGHKTIICFETFTGGSNLGWTFIVLRDYSCLSQALHSAAEQLKCQKALITREKWDLLLLCSCALFPQSSWDTSLSKVTQHPCMEEELNYPTYRRRKGRKMNLFGGAAWWQQWWGGAWVCSGPFWVLISKPASPSLAYTTHHTGREGRNKRSGWI